MSRLKYLGVGLIGLATGWMVGMSISPAVNTVLGAVVGVAATVIASLCGIEGKESGDAAVPNGKLQHIKVNPWPLAVLCIGLAVGSGLGICTRTFQLLGPSTPAVATATSNLDSSGNIILSGERSASGSSPTLMSVLFAGSEVDADPSTFTEVSDFVDFLYANPMTRSAATRLNSKLKSSSELSAVDALKCVFAEPKP